MSISELYQKVLEIESKFTNNSNTMMSIMVNRRGTTYKITHTIANGGEVTTGYGVSNIKELLTVFEMGMAARYRFKDSKPDDLSL